jgi:hypothetical protein
MKNPKIQRQVSRQDAKSAKLWISDVLGGLRVVAANSFSLER